MPESELVRLAKINADDQAVAAIGRELVAQAASNELAERLGKPIKDPMVVRNVSAGSKVPSDLLGTPGLQFDPTSKVADAGWEKTWTNLGLWDRNWSQNETGRSTPTNLGTLSDRFNLDRVLSAEELAVVKELKLRP